MIIHCVEYRGVFWNFLWQIIKSQIAAVDRVHRLHVPGQDEAELARAVPQLVIAVAELSYRLFEGYFVEW